MASAPSALKMQSGFLWAMLGLSLGICFGRGWRTVSCATDINQARLSAELERVKTDQLTQKWATKWPEEIYAVNEFRTEIGLPKLTRNRILA